MAKRKKVKGKIIKQPASKEPAGMEIVKPDAELKNVPGHHAAVTEDMVKEFLFGSETKLTEQQKILFMRTAIASNLNPFKREIYAVPYEEKWYDQKAGRKVSYNPPRYRMSLITGYEVYLKRAERSGKLQGWKAWTDGEGDKMKACIEIHRRDWKEPLYHEVFMGEYKQKNHMWDEKPATMLKKVCIAQGFRLAFPDELGGIPYSSEELPDNMTTVNAEVLPEPARKKLDKPAAEKAPEPVKKFTLPAGLTPDTLCDLGAYKKFPKAYKSITIGNLLTLRSNSTNPEELDGVLNFLIRERITACIDNSMNAARLKTALEELLDIEYKVKDIVDLPIEKKIAVLNFVEDRIKGETK